MLLGRIFASPSIANGMRSHSRFAACMRISVWEESRTKICGPPYYSMRISMYTLQVKFHELTNDNMARLQQKISETFPDRELSAISFRSEIMDLYKDSRQFRDSVMIGGLVTLLVTLIGLIGYTNDEVSRRRKEIAVRRVNGATLWDILRLFIKDIGYICIYAVILGGGIAYFVLQKWQEQFTEKVPLSWYIFLGCGVCVLLIIYSVVCLDARKTANDNPVNCLKSE